VSHSSVRNTSRTAMVNLVVSICALGAIVCASSARSGQASYAAHVGAEPPAVTNAYSTRDLSKYDSLPLIERTVDRTNSWVKEEMQGQTLLVRQFVWEHWRDRRRGHVRAKWNLDRGEVVEWHVFIEPATKGEWRLIKISTYSGNGSRPKAITSETRRVVRVLASSWKSIPKSSKVSVGDYQLAYINAEGKAASLDF
jgi:hypothetical protein